MIERIAMHAPSFVLLLTIGLLVRHLNRSYYLKHKEDSKSIQWVHDNVKVLVVRRYVFRGVIIHPILEELIFRMPLIILFGELSLTAWVAIIISSIVFSITHLLNAERDERDNITFSTLMQRYKSGLLGSDNYTEEFLKIHNRLPVPKKSKGFVKNPTQVIAAIVAGLMAGYFGIKLQSIWVSVAIHALVNTSPIILIVLLPVVLWIIDPLWPVWWRIQSEWRKFTRKR